LSKKQIVVIAVRKSVLIFEEGRLMLITSKPLFIQNSDHTFTAREEGRRAIDAEMETSKVVQQLKEDRMIGESSWRLGTVTKESNFSIYQDSESINDQWQYLNNQGPAGEQAAEYLAQMVTEKRDLIDGYLKSYDVMTHELSFLVKADNIKDIDLASILNNVKAGRAASENADGSILPQSELIDDFAARNTEQINTVNTQIEQIYQQPKTLAHWLDQKNIDRPLSMDKLVDQSQYMYLNGKAEKSETLIGISDQYGVLKGEHILEDTMLDLLGVKFVGMDFTIRATSTPIRRNDDRAALQEYLQTSEPIANSFNDSIATQLTPRFTFQDILDNIKEGRDPASVYTSEGYQVHPQADLIDSYVVNNQSQLQAVIDMQVALENPLTYEQWIAIPENEDRVFQKIEELYGIERWEVGELSRGERFDRRYAEDEFRADATYYKGLEPMSAAQWKEGLTQEAVALAKELETLLEQAQGSNPEPLTMDQLITNFRKGEPLGLLADGTMHPAAVSIEAAFESKQLQLADYVDSQWLRDGTPHSSQSEEERSQEMLKDVVKMIKDSQEVWKFDALMGIMDIAADAVKADDESLNDEEASTSEELLGNKALVSYLNVYNAQGR